MREDTLPGDSVPEEEVLKILDEMKDRDLQYDKFFSTTCTMPPSSVDDCWTIGSIMPTLVIVSLHARWYLQPASFGLFYTTQ